MSVETIAMHAGHHPDPATGFEREPDLTYRAGFVYTRNSLDGALR